MLSNLYLITILGAMGAGVWHARLIKANKPIRHGLWLLLYAFVGGLLAAWLVGPYWAFPAAMGMAGLFSMWFRLTLNTRRGLLPSYMGPDPSDTSRKRSQYDLLCWRIAGRIDWPPVVVAITIESTASLLVAALYSLFK